MRERLRLRRALLGGAALGAAAAGAAALSLTAEARAFDARASEMLALLAASASVAGAGALLLVDRYAPHASSVRRAALAALLALAGGLGLQMLGAGLHFYLNAYGEQAGFDRLRGWTGLVFTMGQGALYYALFGMRLMWPWALVGVAAVALLAAPPLRPRPGPARRSL